MDQQNKQSGNVAAIVTMFALFFMIAFVTNFASPMGVIAKNQFNASNALSQLGNAANFFAYLFMGIPGGLILKRKGYKFTALLAVAVGFTGVGIQLLSGYVGSFGVYVAGAFVAGFSMCLLNLVVNPMLNTLGGEGKKGNQLVQFGCSINSIGATLSPVVLGWLIGEITKDTSFITEVWPERRACFSSAVSMCGSGIFDDATITNASAKSPIAAISAGAASETAVFGVILPIRMPRMIGASVAPTELSEQPICTSWLPFLPSPPSVLSIGLTTRFSMHIEKPAMNAPPT